jgi:multicomponent Na+:H+ antiporter subunit G
LAESVVAALVLAGSALSLIAALGLHRFGDAFARMHAAGKPATLGLALVLSAAILRHGTIGTEVATLLFVLLTSPVGTHMVAKAMYDSGYRPWEEAAKPAPRRRRR